MTSDNLTMAQFVERLGIAIAAQSVTDNPHMDGSKTMDNWRCVLAKRDGDARRTMTVYFSKGVGHHGAAPAAAEVLDCLASDVAGVENARSFEDWCADYGYSADSRKAEKIFRQCERQAQKLKRFLSTAAYETLLWKTERL